MSEAMNLLELTTNIRTLKEKVAAGELSDSQVKDTLDSLKLPRDQKLDRIADWMDDNEGTIAMAQEKILYWQNELRSMENLNRRLNDYVTEAIDKSGCKRIKTKNHIFTPRNYKASTVIEQLGLIPQEYIKTTTPKPVSRPDKAAIYKALKAGKEVPGAHLKPNRKTKIL